MRPIASLLAVAVAVGLLLPLELLPDTQAVQIVGGFWGMLLGVGVLAAWAAVWR